MKDVIEMLLSKQATLEADKEVEKALACEKIDAEYAERSGQYAAMLLMAGYTPPVLSETELIDTATEQSEQAEAAEPVTGNVSGTQVVY